MFPQTLSHWLEYVEALHPAQIEMGLDRVLNVACELGLESPRYAPAPRSIIVAGTNGKGSTCIFTEALLRQAGLRVGCTLSPHLHRFNERIRIDGEPLGDAALCRAFARVEAARRNVPLTYFEYSALVALDCFRTGGVEAAILEVGLGGRLDAFNLVSADVAAITSIGLDHQEYLGDDLESIGREKAGVLRSGQQVVLGEQVPESVVERAIMLACSVRRAGQDFQVDANAEGWDYRGVAGHFSRLPWGRLAPENCALGIEIASRFVRVDEPLVRSALREATLEGRCDARSFRGRLLLLDVAHNPAGARFLRRQIEARYPGRRFSALLGMLVEKDPAGVVEALAPLTRGWICVPTQGARGLSAEDLAGRLPAGVQSVVAADALEGLERALSSSAPEDGILAVGSFNLVEQIADCLKSGARPDPNEHPIA